MRWKRTETAIENVASIMVSSYEPFAKAVSELFAIGPVPYSGIVLTRNDHLADGSTIEKSTYSKGGLKFLYRSYAETEIGDSGFPISALKRLLEKIAVLYLCDVVGLSSENVTLEACWAVCQRDGDYGTLHNHIPPDHEDGDRFSGILYLETPPSINPSTFPNGCLHIVTANEVLYFPPIPGSVVVWPAHLIHGIHPFRGPGERLGVAFDLITD